MRNRIYQLRCLKLRWG